MTKKDEDQSLQRVVQDSENLLEMLDEINESDTSSDHRYEEEYSKVDPHHSQRFQQANKINPKALALVGWISAGLLIVLVGVASQYSSTNSDRYALGGSDSNFERPEQKELKSHTPDIQQDDRSSPTPSEEVNFNGINLPVTNHLCNEKGTFCIYGLATVVKNETGSASYSYTDVSNGERVEINGQIGIANLEKSSDGSRTISFSFRDDQSRTTPGWAAAGYFNLDQDSKQPGIRTIFTTTESFGPKTPVGLENTSYLFPR